MPINPEIFRGYDVRGVVGKDLTEETFYLLGRGYATFLAKRRIKTCPIGRDNRKESQAFLNSFIKGLNDSGIDTIDIGLSLTQMVYFSSYIFLTRACAMITASHNPKEFNGVKLGTGYSETMSTQDIQNLREIVEDGRFAKGRGKNRRFSLFPSYLKEVLKYFRLTKKWKIVVDCCTSSSGLFYPTIFSKAGCQVIKQNCTPDSSFPLGTPDPTDETVIKRITDRVIKEKADLGFAFDADGDRMAVVDETGKVHWMDIVLSLFAVDILDYLPGSTIIYNNLCSRSVPEVIQKHGGVPIMWKTGHAFIKSKMKETGAILGGELSGHIFFSDSYFGHDDAAFACLRLLSYLERVGKSLGQAISEFSRHIGSPEIKLGVPDNIKFQLVEENIRHDLTALWPGATVNDIDGIRLETTDSMVVVRASQNGPYITVRFEADNQIIYDNVKAKLKQILTKYSQVDWHQGVNTYALS